MIPKIKINEVHVIKLKLELKSELRLAKRTHTKFYHKNNKKTAPKCTMIDHTKSIIVTPKV